MKYKVGDKVRIKSLDWYNENKSKSHGTVACGSKYFDYDMREWCGKTMTILNAYQTCYIMKEDGAKDLWTDEMIEGLVEEDNDHSQWTGLKVELELSKTVIDVSNVESLHGERFMSGFVKAIIPPEGYIFKDENGNVINATKIILEKKKREYPKTYEECCKVLGYDDRETYCVCHTGANERLFESLYCLKVCRDAYWKIAGAWKPEYPFNTARYVITNSRGFAGKVLVYDTAKNYILEFPTEEMRDAFYENFKELIEQCKELL